MRRQSELCTSIIQQAKNGAKVISRTMDWNQLVDSPVFIPKDYEWKSAYDNQLIKNSYSIIGAGHRLFDEIDLSDGINQWGLAVQKLTFKNGTNYPEYSKNGKINLAPFELPLYLLGNFRSVEEIERKISDFYLLDDQFAQRKYKHLELYYILIDRTGKTILLQPSGQPMRIFNNPLGIATNTFNFEQQLGRLKAYLDLKPDFENNKLEKFTSRISSGSFNGKKTPPGSYTPSGRLFRAAYYKERIDLAASEKQALNNCWRLLDSVTVPKSSKYQPTYSVYRSAACLSSLTYYFEEYYSFNPIKINLNKEASMNSSVKFYTCDSSVR
ncbi:penicillin V acylase related amidase [Liquorilactobacillus nagelii DSM 13675]|jgi:choloylglycine hydrolase|nr:penicillin V acylase related amidase [Liquorilactobacillus nagelii DSM 13675]